jgi:hypothetical protein
VDVLDELHDRKDKLVSRIYMRKLEELLLEHDRYEGLKGSMKALHAP